MVHTAAYAPVRSPLEGHASGNWPNAVGQLGVQLSVALLPSLTQVRPGTAGLPGLLSALNTVFGDTVPRRIGQSVRTEFGLLARSGPQEFLLVGDDPTDRAALLRTTVDADTGAVTDLSHASYRIRLDGMQCRSVLTKLFALDLRASAFPIGDIVAHSTGPLPSALHRLGLDTFDLYVCGASANDPLATVLDAAQEYGVTLQLG